MAKTVTLGLRIPSEKMEELKTEAKLAGNTVTQLVQNQLIGVSEVTQLRQQVEDLQWEISELKKRTEKKIPKTYLFRCLCSIVPDNITSTPKIRHDLNRYKKCMKELGWMDIA